MALNASTYAELGYEELFQLADKIWNGCMRLFRESAAIYADMMLYAPADRDGKRRQAGVLLAAGREQSALHDEMQAELRDRRAARQAPVTGGHAYPVTRPLASTRDTSGDMTTDEVRDFEANWTAE